MHCDRRKGIQKANAQQKLLDAAAIARRAERRKLAVQGDSQVGSEARPVKWVGCQWLMEGYCGRQEE